MGHCLFIESSNVEHQDRSSLSGSLRCRADWQHFIGPIERWGSCNPWEGHFGAVVLPFCKPERLAVLCYIFEYTDNIALDETEYRTVRSNAEVVIESWKEMISTTAKRNKKRGFDNPDEYVDYRIIDTGAPFVDMLMRFGMGILLTDDEQKLIEPIVKPCYAALGLANDYFSFDVEWEEFQAESDETAMTSAYLQNMADFAAGEGKDKKLQTYLEAQGYQVPGNIAWSLRCPRYSTQLRDETASLLHKEPIPASKGAQEPRIMKAEAEATPRIREKFIDGLNVWLVLRDNRVNQLKRIAQTLHNASLMLDDIEDHSPLRRGRPSTHMIFGTEQRINSANHLLVDVMGKSCDLYWTRQGECPSEVEYLAMIRQKTGGLFRLLTRLMAQIAPVRRKGLDMQLASLSDVLGEFFQIRDDYKNLTEEYTGQKGFCEDLDECKFSYPLIHALRSQPKKPGSIQYTEAKMRQLMEKITGAVVSLEGETGSPNWVKILIILSDANSFPLHKTTGQDSGKTVSQPSGFFLMELAKPLQKLLDAGHEITFASPKGQEPQPDPNSESLLAFAGNFYKRRRENDLLERMKKENGFSRPRILSSITTDELSSFAGIFIPGGHAPLSDLGDNKDLGRILSYFHKENKPTAAICHGPYALLSTKTSDDEFAYKGYKITSWSDAEEKVMETMLGGEVEKVESALRNEGAEMVTGAGEKVGQTTLHRELLTGGNPMAADELGTRFVRMVSV
ncbi:class I glutamine amidotransferase-like protein [Aspergillus undulatus]|uniref:class I glutamine amidotransferase-like protein n=1 Tax=Aspergillus undulatus TaxID=1810928 RepID=UPI003CCCCD49